MLFQQKKETIQYNAALVITGAIRGSSGEHFLSSREELYEELGL